MFPLIDQNHPAGCVAGHVERAVQQEDRGEVRWRGLNEHAQLTPCVRLGRRRWCWAVASFSTLRERCVLPSDPRLRRARVIFRIIAVVANGMVPTLLDVVRIRNKTIATRICLLVRVLAAGAAWVLMMTRGTNFAVAIDEWIANACACAIRDIQRTPFSTLAPTLTSSLLRKRAHT